MSNFVYRYFPLLLFITFFHYSYANSNETQRIENLKDSIDKYFYTEPAKGCVYVLELDREAERQKNNYYQAFAKAKLVEYYYPQFDNDSIVAAAEIAEAFARQHKEYGIMFVVQQTIIQRYANQGMFTLALSKAGRMYNEARELEDNGNMARAAAALANVYKHLNQYKESVSYLCESLRLLKSTENGAISALRLENYQELAFAELTLDQYEQTILYVDSMHQCIDLRHKEKGINDVETAYIAEYLLARANIGLNRMEAAKKHIEKTEELYNANYPLSFRFLLDQMYIVYYNRQKEYAKAYDYNERMIQLMREYELKSDLPEALIDKAGILTHLKRYNEAVEAYAEAIELLSENNRSEHARQLNELRISYDLNKVEQQALEARLQLRFIRKIAVVISLIAILLFVLGAVIYRNNRRISFKNKKLVARLHEQDVLIRKNKQLEQRLKEMQPESDTAPQKVEILSMREKFEKLMRIEKLYTDSNISRKAIQEKLGISERALRALIQECYGQTYSGYMAEIRAQHARELLSDTTNTDTAEQIGYESGFGSRSTFYRQFHEFYGLTPDEYRKHVSTTQVQTSESE